MNGAARAESVRIVVDGGRRVSGRLSAPAGAAACLILAHGAGAGMGHPFMASVADGLAERHVATLRYQFPYMEQGLKRPDAPPVSQATVRAAVAEASRLVPRLTLFAGGKSFGGRMTSHAQAASPIPGIRGLVFLGFPLHPAGRPSEERAKHLFDIEIPMLFLQGTRDTLAGVDLLQNVVARLGGSATLKLYEHADHSFGVPVRLGRTSDVRAALLNDLCAWIDDQMRRERQSSRLGTTSMEP